VLARDQRSNEADPAVNQSAFRQGDQGPIFRTFFSGENFGANSAENLPPKMLGKMEFSAEKVLKNCFSKKFRGIFRGKSLSAEKNVRKIGA
jgi:hypothetical protein